MEDLYQAGFKRDDVLGALRILPFVGLPLPTFPLRAPPLNDLVLER